jgi:endonuclease/exonuclease/phosphatase (EEP) superfamily protein YafD
MTGPSRWNSAAARALLGAFALLLAGCASAPKESRLLTSGPDGQVLATKQRVGSVVPGSELSFGSAMHALDPGSVRLLSWNIHKESDPGWESDLDRYAAENDLLLLQEAVLNAPMREVLKRQGHCWQMVGAFAIGGLERGVLVAAKTAPVSARALRVYEPLFPLPKSAIVTRYQLIGSRKKLAVANLHGINFSLGVRRFREQIEEVANELSQHDGPVIFGGDFNTWSRKRHGVLGEAAKRLSLVEVVLNPDDRRTAFGRHLDHLFIRGFSVLDARSPGVKSSDHNPILVRLVAKHTETENSAGGMTLK